jgi:hypothetical protein
MLARRLYTSGHGQGNRLLSAPTKQATEERKPRRIHLPLIEANYAWLSIAPCNNRRRSFRQQLVRFCSQALDTEHSGSVLLRCSPRQVERARCALDTERLASLLAGFTVYHEHAPGKFPRFCAPPPRGDRSACASWAGGSSAHVSWELTGGSRWGAAHVRAIDLRLWVAFQSNSLENVAAHSDTVLQTSMWVIVCRLWSLF